LVKLKRRCHPVTPVTVSHSYYRSFLSATSKRVLKVVDESPIPITPLEISQGIKINAATVRKTLARLVKKGFIRKITYGLYASLKSSVTLESSMGGGCDGPRLHCLRLSASGLVGASGCRRRDFGLVKVTVQRFGNGSGAVFVDCVDPCSLDYPAFRLLLDAIGPDLDWLGVQDWRRLRVNSFEFNVDWFGARLDGVKAVTVKAFDGSFRRMYNKRFGVRDEVKAVGSRRVEDVLLLMQGGASMYSLLQFLFRTVQQLELQYKLTAETNLQNRRIFEEFLRRRARKK
jgi:hypothetical protein